MRGPDLLAESNLAILGIGLMGGSLALALRGHCLELLGCDPDAETLAQAANLDVFDRISSDPAEILPKADVVVLAAPVKAILGIIKELPSLHPGSATVLDLGSTKVNIVQALEELPGRFDPLGGHPMCGKETSGLKNADAGLFKGATFAFTALERTSSRAKTFADQLAQVVGSKPLWIDADSHDQWAAAVSHLPYLMATALAAATPSESAVLIGPGFRSNTRIADTPATIMVDVLETNQKYVLGSLNRFRDEINQLESLLLKGNFEGLNQQLMQSAQKHQSLLMNSSLENHQ